MDGWMDGLGVVVNESMGDPSFSLFFFFACLLAFVTRRAATC